MRIHPLDPLLINQIAAGEVIERPAAALKELMENSIDAGATQIDVCIEHGGLERLQVRDNGHGIHPDDLALAVTQHATSKIAKEKDLHHIHSLGFRGEALASMSAVTRFTITSRTTEQPHAHQLQVIGREHHASQHAAAHPVGTTVILSDLFFNTPARRQFLKSDKTEYLHCEEVFKRMALSHFYVGFSLKNGEKNRFNLPSATNRLQQENRLAKLCGKPFVSNSVYLDAHAEPMQLSGWVGLPDYHKSQTDTQFCFLNQRAIRDKVVLHAIRQAYQNLLPPGRQPCFVLSLQMDPSLFDINVHPTKHEVRFRDARLVHDFILHTVRAALQQGEPEMFERKPVVDAIQVPVTHTVKPHQDNNQCNDYTVGFTLKNRYFVTKEDEELKVIDMHEVYADWLRAQFENKQLTMKPLLMPLTVKTNVSNEVLDALRACYFDLDWLDEHTVMVRQIPSDLRLSSVDGFLQALLLKDFNETDVIKKIIVSATQTLVLDDAHLETCLTFIRGLLRTLEHSIASEGDPASSAG
ncbi:MAG: hypothetical protein DHS20C10_07290 [marine bacterium B5-7]|nr:MAG: hypothetical protein DHS20C10_07290 [marine bacterium B5-7]